MTSQGSPEAACPGGKKLGVDRFCWDSRAPTVHRRVTAPLASTPKRSGSSADSYSGRPRTCSPCRRGCGRTRSSTRSGHPCCPAKAARPQGRELIAARRGGRTCCLLVSTTTFERGTGWTAHNRTFADFGDRTWYQRRFQGRRSKFEHHTVPPVRGAHRNSSICLQGRGDASELAEPRDGQRPSTRPAIRVQTTP